MSELLKKKWQTPTITLLATDTLNGGSNPAAHEANFTPNHTHYQYPGGNTTPINAPAFYAFNS